MSINRETCFVIMPFSKTTKDHTKSYWTEHFKSFLKPLIEEYPGLEAHRSKALRGDILRQIITDLVVSHVVVADLTDHNPNVYWELGVRQSFKHGAVTIAEVGTDFPFDVSTKGTLFYYPTSHLKTAEFRSDFKEAIQDCLTNPDRPDSHVLETLSGRGTLFEIFRREEAIRRLDAVLSECNVNLKCLNSVIEQAQRNQKDPDKRQFTGRRLRTSAAELLITTRYVDQDQSFFELAEEYLDDASSLNDQLNLWEHSPNATEKWILKVGASTKGLANRFKTEVTTAREALSKRF